MFGSGEGGKALKPEAWAGWAQIGFTGALVLLTVFYAWQTRRQVDASLKQVSASREAVEEMRRTREAQARAYVTVELWPWDRTMSDFDLAIRNYGSGAARDIKITFEQNFRDPRYSNGPRMNELAIFHTLRFLAPHDEFLFFIGTREWLKQPDIPITWKGVVEFTDDIGRQKMAFELDRSQFEQLSHEVSSSAPLIRRGWGRLQEPEAKPRIARMVDLAPGPSV